MSVKYKIRDQHGLNYLTCAITGWVDLFSRQVYRDIVLDSWRYCQQHKGFQVHAYTILPNHLHLIASCQPPFQLGEVMRDWKAHTARQILLYLQDKQYPESRREWLLYLFSYFAVGKKDKQTYQVWQHDSHPIELYSEIDIVGSIIVLYAGIRSKTLLRRWAWLEGRVEEVPAEAELAVSSSFRHLWAQPRAKRVR